MHGRAVQYFTNAGVTPPDADTASAIYDLGIYMLAGTWFNARGTLAIGQVPAPLERTVQAIISAIALKSPADLSTRNRLREARSCRRL